MLAYICFAGLKKIHNLRLCQPNGFIFQRVLGFNVWSNVAPFGPGSTILDLEDFIVSNNLLPLGSLVYLLFCTSRYGWGFKNFLGEANEGKGIKFPVWARVYVSYIIPVVVLYIFVQGYWSKFFA